MGIFEDAWNWTKDAVEDVGEFVVDTVTGGMSKEARETMDSTEELEKNTGVALGSMASSVKEVSDSAATLLKDMDGMIVSERLFPRTQADLSEAEWNYLQGLLDEKEGLLNKSYDSGMFGLVQKAVDAMRISVIDAEIHKLLYMEPGVIPSTVSSVNDVVKRFNTVEQPKIEDILDSVDDNLEESQEILVEVKKLFVTKTLQPVPLTELTPVLQQRLDYLIEESKLAESAIKGHYEIMGQMRDYSLKNTVLTPIFKEPSKLAIAVAATGHGVIENAPLTDGGSPETGSPGSAVINKKSASPAKEHIVIGNAKQDFDKIARSSLSNYSKLVQHPVGMRAASLAIDDTMYHQVEKLHGLQKAKLRQQDRDYARIKKDMDRIKYKQVDTPGVIPRILLAVQETIERLNREDQPRFERILESVNGNLKETQGILSNINQSSGKVMGLVSKYDLLVKIGLAISCFAIVVTLVLIPILLIRVILFGLV